MLFRLNAALPLALSLIATPVLAQAAQGTASYPGGTTLVAAPQVPAAEDIAARETWIGECGRRLDVANDGRDGPGPFRQICAAWLDYFQRTGVRAREAYANPPTIPVTYVPMRVMVPCPPARVEARAAVRMRHFRHRHDKRVRVD